MTLHFFFSKGKEEKNKIILVTLKKNCMFCAF